MTRKNIKFCILKQKSIKESVMGSLMLFRMLYEVSHNHTFRGENCLLYARYRVRRTPSRGTPYS